MPENVSCQVVTLQKWTLQMDREEEENGEKEKETERREPWPEEEELTVLWL